MKLGAQMSTAGGLFTAFDRGQVAGCETMMIFSKSNRQWQAKELAEADIAAWNAAATGHPQINPVTIHAAYLINVASPDPALWEKSYLALKDEVERAAALNIPFLTFHPGAYMVSDEATGLAAAARALRRLVEETAGCDTVICLETMAGTGSTLGHTFEQLATMLQHGTPSGTTNSSARLGVCFDTCHVFAAGYEIRSAEAYAQTMTEFDRLVGLDKIKCFHFNDSKNPLGSHKDRHEHIGRGEIGLEGFANFIRDPRWADHPAHLETPKTETAEDGTEIEMDPVNLATLRRLAT